MHGIFLLIKKDLGIEQYVLGLVNESLGLFDIILSWMFCRSSQLILHGLENSKKSLSDLLP